MVTLIYGFIRWWIGSGIFDRIKELVVMMMNSDVSDVEKKQYVLDKISEEYSTLKGRVVDLIINIILVQLKGSGL